MPVEKNFYNIVPFAETDSATYFNRLKKQLHSEIGEAKKEYILKIDEQEYKAYLRNTYHLEPLVIYFDKLEVEKPDSGLRTLEEIRNRFIKTLPKDYSFSLKLPYSGSENIFEIRPENHQTVGETRISVNKQESKISILITVSDTDSQLFNKEKDKNIKQAFANLNAANSAVIIWNSNLPQFIDITFKTIKDRYIRENRFFEEIKLKIDNTSSSIFSVPSIRKIEIPKPSSLSNKSFSFEPTLSYEVYQDILKLIYTAGKSMERKPSLYENKDEESLRDLFVFLLETRYEATSASGETFNKNGKTDIVLKFEDGTNLFVAECKFWNGLIAYQQAISQLFERYLTWRDSKVALMIFVKNKNMHNVIEAVKNNTSMHPYFKRENDAHGESSFGYVFQLPHDSDKEVMLEVMIFHYYS